MAENNNTNPANQDDQVFDFGDDADARTASGYEIDFNVEGLTNAIRGATGNTDYFGVIFSNTISVFAGASVVGATVKGPDTSATEDLLTSTTLARAPDVDDATTGVPIEVEEGDGFICRTGHRDNVITDFNSRTGQDINDRNQGNSDSYTNLHDLRQNIADDGVLNPSIRDWSDNDALGGSITLTGVVGDDLVFDKVNLACFVRGSRILTTRGEVMVEDLTAGDMVHTMDNGLQPVLHVVSRRVSARAEFAPIVISAGALGNTRDLLVSPRHCMLITGWQSQIMFGEGEVLVPAEHLVNGDTIYQQRARMVEYYQIVFERHEIIYAEGIASESFLVSAQSVRQQDQVTYYELIALFPGLITAPERFNKSARRSLVQRETKMLTAIAS